MNDELELYQSRDADWLSGNSEHFSLGVKWTLGSYLL